MMKSTDELLKELTLEEKASLLSGHKSWHTVAIPRLGIPSIFLTDGPHGLRKKRADSKDVGLGSTELSTAFPTAASTACSFNTELLYEMGVAMGKECNHYGVDLILGPAVNIKRNPLCGRSFEYFSEDPLLTGEMGAALAGGIESRGVGTSVKHYACNNNETNRYFGNSIVDERAMREIYLRGFERIVKKAKPATLMCAYNKVAGEYASENRKLLTDIPRGEWGFEGLIMSDWGAVNDRVKGLKAGLDLEMPGDIGYNRQAIIDAVRSGELEESVVDTAVSRVLAIVRRALENRRDCTAPFEENARLAKKAAIESAVLLKNESNTLPLRKDGEYLVIGEMFENMRYQGAGSSLLNPYKLTSPKSAFDDAGVKYTYLKGFVANDSTPSQKLENEALARAESFDTLLFFGGLSENAESEGFDRKDMLLPENQRSLLRKLTELGKRVIFVMYGGSPVELDDAEGCAAILNMYLPGESGGDATYALLFGDESPSGRLAESWPYKYSDVPFAEEYTKTTNDVYKESLFVGYRYYSSFGVPVRYPFGYGLSYSRFSYRDLTVSDDGDAVSARVKVKNDGTVSASEVTELYVDAPLTELVKPVRELRAFTKVRLAPGEEREITLTVPKYDLCRYVSGEWSLEGGRYTFLIASDVNTPILEAELEIEGKELSSDHHTRECYSTRERMLAITDTDYSKIFGDEIVLEETKRPYNLNTPLRDYRTLGGKFLKGLIGFGVGVMRFFLKMKKDSPEKTTAIKNLDFSYATILSISLRALSNTSEGMLSHRRAEGLLAIANNNPFKGIWLLITPEKCTKLPKQE